MIKSTRINKIFLFTLLITLCLTLFFFLASPTVTGSNEMASFVSEQEEKEEVEGNEADEVYEPNEASDNEEIEDPVTGSSDWEEVLIGFYGRPNISNLNIQEGEITKEFTLVNVVAARLPQQAILALSRNPQVRYIEPDHEITKFNQIVPWGINRVFGQETYYFPTWQKVNIDIISVAVLDTGIDRNHVDLPNLRGGINTRDGTDWGSDGDGHGTHVAGIIAALDNDIGVVGMAPGIDLYAVKVLNDQGSGNTSHLIAGIEWAVNNNIQIINMSLGSSSYNQSLKDSCDTAYEAGAILVAAAGNEGNNSSNNVDYPARYASVIAVAASNENDGLASFSSVGPSVEFIAPGVNINSTMPGSEFGSYSGTSMASPHVAGAAALLWSADRSLGNVEVRQVLRNTAQDIGLTANQQGYGMVRADLAVAEVTAGAALGLLSGKTAKIRSNRRFAALPSCLLSVQGWSAHRYGKL